MWRWKLCVKADAGIWASVWTLEREFGVGYHISSHLWDIERPGLVTGEQRMKVAS